MTNVKQSNVENAPATAAQPKLNMSAEDVMNQPGNRIRKVENLLMYTGSVITPESIQELVEQANKDTTVTEVFISNKQFPPGAARELTKLQHVTRIMLIGNTIPTEELAEVARIAGLKELALDDMTNIDDAVVAFAEAGSTQRKLFANYSLLGDKAIDALAAHSEIEALMGDRVNAKLKAARESYLTDSAISRVVEPPILVSGDTPVSDEALEKAHQQSSGQKDQVNPPSPNPDETVKPGSSEFFVTTMRPLKARQ